MLAVRRAGAEDVPTVHAVTAAAYQRYVAELGEPPPPMAMDYAPYVMAGETWLLLDEGRVVATAVLELAADHLVIVNLAVLPDAQGLGAGRQMIALAEARARALGLGELRLYTHPKMTRNIGIYGKAGFTETGRRPNPRRAGWMLVDMSKTLA